MGGSHFLGILLPYGLGFEFGFCSGYLFYEVYHRFLHIRPPKTALGIKMRKHHMIHHFHDPNSNHGVTNTWIDRSQKTYLEISQVNYPKEFAPSWLLNETRTQIRPEYAEHFNLI
jgi:sterol desaturase/sphingolipid hydroxylase (fatty acid hydroxylase superfamily)